MSRKVVMILSILYESHSCRCGEIPLVNHVAPHNLRGKLCELLGHQRRAGVAGPLTSGWWGKAKRNRGIEFRQRRHLSVEPLHRIRAMPVRPTDTGAKFLNT